MEKTEELAWAAGLFEGEGSVRINKATGQNKGSLMVSIVNTDHEVVQFFQNRWPAYMKAATGLRSDQRPAMVWVIAARKAAVFLRAIYPYVQTKRVRERIDVGLQFQDGKRSRWEQDDQYDSDQFAAYLWLRELNMRGVGPRVQE